MRRAVIVSTARTPIGQAYRGAFNDTQPQALAGHAIAEAVRRAGVAPAEIDDVIIGAAIQQGAQGFNIARQSALRAGLPDSVPAMSIDRQCSSGMMAIATAAKEIMHDGMTIAVGGGVESVSLVQNDKMIRTRGDDPELVARIPALYMTMIETAEIVAERYKVSREAQDEYALRSQQRTAAAQQAGRFDDEIVSLPSVMIATDRATGETSNKPVTLDKDEGNRPDTSLEGLANLKPVFKDGQRIREGKFITAGNASQLSDGASACVLMEESEAERRGLSPLGIYRGIAVAGCAPDEMGIGPVFAVPKLLGAARAQDRRHRSVGTERGVRLPGGLLPRPPRHPARQAQRQWRRDLDRPSLRHVGRADGRPRPDRGQAPRRQARRLHDVRRRRHGRGRPVRGGVKKNALTQRTRRVAEEQKYNIIYCHPGESRDPFRPWIPASAGMTNVGNSSLRILCVLCVDALLFFLKG